MDLTNLIDSVKNESAEMSTLSIKRAINIAIAESSPELAYELACIVDNGVIKNVERLRMDLEKVVIKSKNPEFAYLYARDIPGANIEMLEKVVLDAKNPYYSCEFASDIPNANTQKHQEIVIKSKDVQMAYRFALYVDNADLGPLENMVIKSQDPKLIYKFRETVVNANTRKLNLALAKLKKNMNFDNNFEL